MITYTENGTSCENQFVNVVNITRAGVCVRAIVNCYSVSCELMSNKDYKRQLFLATDTPGR